MENINNEIELVPYKSSESIDKNYLIELIINFWKEHNGILQNIDETINDINEWTKSGHKLYLIKYDNNYIGFAHLGSRGCEIDWLEDIFVLPKYQRKGIGSKVIYMLEQIVKEYSDSLYIEVATRNINALRLYNKIGYNCLNTVTIRKDFKPDNLKTISKEKINDLDFDIKTTK